MFGFLPPGALVSSLIRSQDPTWSVGACRVSTCCVLSPPNCSSKGRFRKTVGPLDTSRTRGSLYPSWPFESTLGPSWHLWTLLGPCVSYTIAHAIGDTFGSILMLIVSIFYPGGKTGIGFWCKIALLYGRTSVTTWILYSRQGALLGSPFPLSHCLARSSGPSEVTKI